MRALLDTNILIHREAATVVRQDIGKVFLWLDKLRYEKCVQSGQPDGNPQTPGQTSVYRFMFLRLAPCCIRFASSRRTWGRTFEGSDDDWAIICKSDVEMLGKNERTVVSGVCGLRTSAKRMLEC